MTKYREIDDSVYLSFGKKLLKNKGSEEQIEFLQVCRRGKDDFLQYLNDNLLNEEGVIAGSENIFFDHKFTEVEFGFPPKDTQQIIWKTFKDITKQNASSCGFWSNVIINMMKYGCIKPDYLASNLKNDVNETGIYMLDSAINSDDSEKIDECIRRILRSMGSSAPRGSRIIFSDFSLGKAYWRWKWADSISSKIDLSFQDILNTLDEKGYTEFAAKMHSHKSYISQTNTLGGLLLFLNTNPSILVKNIKKIIDRLGYLSAWKAIEVQSSELNLKEIQKISENL